MIADLNHLETERMQDGAPWLGQVRCAPSSSGDSPRAASSCWGRGRSARPRCAGARSQPRASTSTSSPRATARSSPSRSCTWPTTRPPRGARRDSARAGPLRGAARADRPGTSGPPARRAVPAARIGVHRPAPPVGRDACRPSGLPGVAPVRRHRSRATQRTSTGSGCAAAFPTASSRRRAAPSACAGGRTSSGHVPGARHPASSGRASPAETLRRFWTMLAHQQGGVLNAAQLRAALAA